MLPANAPADPPGNPSRRRNGVVIECSCERCGAWFALAVAQHEGQTILTVEALASG